MNPSILREVLGLAFYFGIYDKLMLSFRKDGEVSLLGSLLAGGCSGLACWMSIYPIDYVKTLIQTDSLENPKFRSAIHCATE
jgi:solute carrier family 25 carnitine/acylcarnitine transporter 20/29